jgi:gentisate 1,2-dioxygenase
MQSDFVPAHWSYVEAKAGMQAAARVVTAEMAERRTFGLRNPIPNNDFATVRTLIAAYQTLLPGETARSHRHTPHALRVLLEARGTYSIVDGERTPMESGDIVLTPAWSWHGHGHEGSEQVYWLDALDIPLTRLLEPMFYEEHPKGLEPVQTTTAVSPMRFAWQDTVSALHRAPMDPAGHVGQVVDLPAPSMPTMTIKAYGWPAGWHGRPYRHVANTIYVVMQGRGHSTIGDRTFEWEFGDAMAAPAWSRLQHHAAADAIVCAISDEHLMRWARYYRFEALDIAASQ